MRTTNNSLLIALIVSTMIFANGCKKGEAGEEPLRFSIDAPANTKSLSASYIVWINVESAMPEGGVEILYTLAGEADNISIPQGPTVFTKFKSTSIILTRLPRQKYCVCKIIVRSKDHNTNYSTTSFRIVYK